MMLFFRPASILSEVIKMGLSVSSLKGPWSPFLLVFALSSRAFASRESGARTLNVTSKANAARRKSGFFFSRIFGLKSIAQSRRLDFGFYLALQLELLILKSNRHTHSFELQPVALKRYLARKNHFILFPLVKNLFCLQDEPLVA